jgi:glycosyltransferase involved in cell wall biosynthesis
MQCGCPVLCAAAASLPEVVGEAALYFDPLDVNQIATTIEHFLSETNLQETLRKKGYQRSAEFHWAKTARKTLDILFSYL